MIPFRFIDGAPMRPYQLRTAHKIFTGNSGDGTAVIVDMGLGKTIAVLHGIAELINWRQLDKPVLIVAPIAVCNTVWRQEALGWSSTTWLQFSLLRGSVSSRRLALYRPAHIYLVNPELLDWLYKELRGSWDRFDMLVVDESSMFKAHNGKRFKLLTNYGDRHTVRDEAGKTVKDETGKAILVGPHKFKRSVIMTGTPAPTSLLNLWAPMYIVDHGKRLHSQFDTYKERFFYKTAQVAEHTFKFEVSPDELEVRPEWMPKDGAPIKIHELIADVTVELSAEDYGMLPETIGDASKGEIPETHIHKIDLPVHIREFYDRMEKEALIELGKDFVMAANGGAKSMLCHQMANGFIYKNDDFGQNVTEHLHDYKLKELVDLIDRIDNNVIVTYHFKADKERIVNALTAANISFGILTSKNSEAMLKLWNGGHLPVMLLHPQSAGHGINAQMGGHHIIWFSQIWSLERYMQTNARIARSGQKNIVGIHHIVAHKTVDELMLMMYKERGDTQTKFRAALRKYQDLRGWNVRDIADFEKELEAVL